MTLNKNMIQNIYLFQLKNVWLLSESSFPSFLETTAIEKQIDNQEFMESFILKFKKQIHHFPKFSFGKKRWKRKTLSMFNQVLNKETIIGIHHSIDSPTLALFQTELKDFLRQVRLFSDELDLSGIGQATRNYVVYMMFNELHQIKPFYNQAAFGYSMLYPFTDNYIDSKLYTAEEKHNYNNLIREKIMGNPISTESIHQLKTCDLLQMIEDKYPRNHDNTIFDLLLMMLDAQEESLLQQHHGPYLSLDRRLDISLYKGGISVLIDRYFVNCPLTKEDLNFYLGFGFFLQLADDLQDIKEDSTQGNQTIFTLDLNPSELEKIVNQMFHFVYNLMNAYETPKKEFQGFILQNCYQLIISSVLGSKEYFSSDYITSLEKHFPISFDYLEKLKSSMVVNKENKESLNYMSILDEMIKEM
jgi:hypothetical protein